MGWWGVGVFDGDEPRDYLANVIGYFEKIVEQVLAGKSPGCNTGNENDPGVSGDGENCLVPTIVMMAALHEAFQSDYLPNTLTVERWKKQYLEMFDLPNPDFDDPGYKMERRRVIERTFDRLLEHCREQTSE